MKAQKHVPVKKEQKENDGKFTQSSLLDRISEARIDRGGIEKGKF